MKRLIYAILTCLFVVTCAFGCAPNMPDDNPKFKGVPLDKMESKDDTGTSTEPEVTTPEDTTESNDASGEEGTE